VSILFNVHCTLEFFFWKLVNSQHFRTKKERRENNRTPSRFHIHTALLRFAKTKNRERVSLSSVCISAAATMCGKLHREAKRKTAHFETRTLNQHENTVANGTFRAKNLKARTKKHHHPPPLPRPPNVQRMYTCCPTTEQSHYLLHQHKQPHTQKTTVSQSPKKTKLTQ